SREPGNVIHTHLGEALYTPRCDRFDQNTSFSATCMMRGSSAVRILPKLLLFLAVTGLLKRVLLVRLNASPRASRLVRSFSRKMRDSAASIWKYVGPATFARPELPNVPFAG